GAFRRIERAGGDPALGTGDRVLESFGFGFGVALAGLGLVEELVDAAGFAAIERAELRLQVRVHERVQPLAGFHHMAVGVVDRAPGGIGHRSRSLGLVREIVEQNYNWARPSGGAVWRSFWPKRRTSRSVPSSRR